MWPKLICSLRKSVPSFSEGLVSIPRTIAEIQWLKIMLKYTPEIGVLVLKSHEEMVYSLGKLKSHVSHIYACLYGYTLPTTSLHCTGQKSCGNTVWQTGNDKNSGQCIVHTIGSICLFLLKSHTHIVDSFQEEERKGSSFPDYQQ